jgi:hypothetical protein
MGRGRSRLLFTTFFKANRFLRLIFSLKPTWLRNLNSCKVLEQDITLISSQEDLMAKQPLLNEGSGLPADNYLGLKTSDALVMQYRKWLDRVGNGMPSYIGWRTNSSSPVSTTSVEERISDPSHRAHHSRFENHVVHHKPTLHALRLIQWMYTAVKSVRDLTLPLFMCYAIIGAFGLLVAAPVNGHLEQEMFIEGMFWLWLTYCSSSMLANGLKRLLSRFFVNFQRFPEPLRNLKNKFSFQ